MEQAQMILELWRTFLRRFWVLAGIGSIGILASGFFAYVLPSVYEAQAKILVESQQIPDELARSTVTASASERLQLIEQRLMTRDNMLRLISDLGLYQDRSDLAVSEKIDQLRRSIQIRPIGLNASSRRGAEISAFTIEVSFTNPASAARIANELVTTVLAQNIRARSERASETLEFFVNEQKRLASDLALIESEITTFKKENEQALPESLEFRRAQLTRVIENDQEADQRLLELDEKLGMLRAALSRASVFAPAASSPEEQQLRELEAELVQKRAVYTESHPDIRALKAQIAAVRASLPSGEIGGGGADPQEIEVASIRSQIDNLNAQNALLKDYKQQLAKSRADLEASINDTPRIEVQLNALYRRHSELQTQYSEIVRKRTEAETGEKLEVNQQAERFEVIENAIVPDEPVSPERKKVVMLGGAMSIALAIGVAFLIETMRPAIRSAGQMERQLDLRPVVTIPYISTQSERRLRAVRTAGFLLLIFVGIPASLFAIDKYYMPLELIGTKIAEKSGLDEFIRMVDERL